MQASIESKRKHLELIISTPQEENARAWQIGHWALGFTHRELPSELMLTALNAAEGMSDVNKAHVVHQLFEFLDTKQRARAREIVANIKDAGWKRQTIQGLNRLEDTLRKEGLWNEW